MPVISPLIFLCLPSFIFLTVSLVRADVVKPTTTALRCLHSHSKKCTIPRVDPYDDLILPDLSGKTTLQIKGGTLFAFDGQLCEKLETVNRLQMGSLQLKVLCLTPALREVSAANNEIDTLKISGSQHKLEHLDLRYNNLKTLDGCEVLVNLVEVHLEHNKIESLDWAVFENMKKLEKLYLNGNKISNVVAEKIIELPVLEYLSLASNELTNLDVSNWKFESLIEFDISSNHLSKIANLHVRFPSSQAVFLANNQWYCEWLQDTWEHFNRTFVTIKDRDENCEGITSSNICCRPEKDIIVENTGLLVELTKVEKEQKTLQLRLESQFEELSRKHKEELTRLEDKLNMLNAASSVVANVTSVDSAQFGFHSEMLKEMNSLAHKKLSAISSQLAENERVQVRLMYTTLELKKSIERGRKSVSGLQAQLDNLRKELYSKAKGG